MTAVCAAGCSPVGNDRHQLLCSLRSRHVPWRLIHLLIPSKTKQYTKQTIIHHTEGSWFQCNAVSANTFTKYKPLVQTLSCKIFKLISFESPYWISVRNLAIYGLIHFATHTKYNILHQVFDCLFLDFDIWNTTTSSYHNAQYIKLRRWHIHLQLRYLPDTLVQDLLTENQHLTAILSIPKKNLIFISCTQRKSAHIYHHINVCPTGMMTVALGHLWDQLN